MHIGIAGPIATDTVASLLNTESAKKLPTGYPGAPLMGTLIRALLANGHRVSAYTHSKDLWRWGEGPVVLPGGPNFQLTVVPVRIHTFRPNRTLPGRMLDVFRQERRALREAMDRDAPDVIHAHWTYEFAMAALDSGRPHVITAHDSPLQVVRYSRSLYRLGRYFVARSVYRRARHLTAVSPYTRDQVQRYARVPITVIGNPVPHHAEEAQKVMPRGIKNLGAPRIAMVLNGWSRFKNGGAGLAAFALLRKQLPRVTLYCFGADYEVGGAAFKWAHARGMHAGVEFVGSLPHYELLQRFRDIDVLLHPALEESCPLTLIEAMGLGVPVVAGERSGGVPWVLDGGRAGMLVDVRSPEAMCRGIMGLLEDRVYERIVEAGNQRVEALYTPAAVAEQYEAVYREAASTPGGEG